MSPPAPSHQPPSTRPTPANPDQPGQPPAQPSPGQARPAQPSPSTLPSTQPQMQNVVPKKRRFAQNVSQKLGCGMVFKPHSCFLEQMPAMSPPAPATSPPALARPQPTQTSQASPAPSPAQPRPGQPLHPAQHPAPDAKCGSKKKAFRPKRFGQNVIGTQTLNNFYKPPKPLNP